MSHGDGLKNFISVVFLLRKEFASEQNWVHMEEWSIECLDKGCICKKGQLFFGGRLLCKLRFGWFRESSFNMTRVGMKILKLEA